MPRDWTLTHADSPTRRRGRESRDRGWRALGFSRAHLFVAVLAGLR